MAIASSGGRCHSVVLTERYARPPRVARTHHRRSHSKLTPLFRIILCQLFRTSTSDKVATIGSVSNYWPSYYFMHICNFSTFALLMRAQNRGLETDMWR